MTYPPQDGDEPGRDEGAAPAPEPGPAPEWGQNPSYGRPQYGQPQYGHPQPGQPQYGQPPYGQPPYGQPPYGPPQYTSPPSYGQPPPYGPQPYAAAQYGPYGPPDQQFGPPPAARKSRVGLIAILTGVALLVIAGAVVLVLSLRPPVLDAAAAERDVAAQFQQREGVAIDLNCPGNMRVRAGATYTCRGKTAEGESVRLTLTITDAKTAAYTWREP